jgi:hypothetical protein
VVSISSSGSFDRTERFLAKMRRGDLYRNLDGYARQGVAALASATPVESGLTAASWTYEIEASSSGAKITWMNTNVISGFPVAIGLQYGHGTGTGGYVQGRDYINPAIRPIFDQIADAVWRVVTSS